MAQLPEAVGNALLEVLDEIHALRVMLTDTEGTDTENLRHKLEETEIVLAKKAVRLTEAVYRASGLADDPVPKKKPLPKTLSPSKRPATAGAKSGNITLGHRITSLCMREESDSQQRVNFKTKRPTTSHSTSRRPLSGQKNTLAQRQRPQSSRPVRPKATSGFADDVISSTTTPLHSFQKQFDERILLRKSSAKEAPFIVHTSKVEGGGGAHSSGGGTPNIKVRSSPFTRKCKTKELSKSFNMSSGESNHHHCKSVPVATTNSSVARTKPNIFLLDKKARPHLIIDSAETVTDSAEFESFYANNVESWDTIIELLILLEDTCSKFSIPKLVVDGDAVARAADAIDQGLLQIDRINFLSYVVNKEEAARYMRQLDVTTLSLNSKSTDAAVKIQSVYRGHTVRLQTTKEIAKRRKIVQLKRDAAVVIQSAARAHTKRLAIRRRLHERRESQNVEYEKLQSDFRKSWNRIQKGRRVVVHLPSFDATQYVGITPQNFTAMQNALLGPHLSFLSDHNVDVIYVSPFPVSSEVIDYYMQLLETSGTPNAAARLRIIHPENIYRLPFHVPLTTALLYSPRALSRLRMLVAGQVSYILPESVTTSEIELAVSLNIPLLATDNILSSHLRQQRRFWDLVREEDEEITLPHGVPLLPAKMEKVLRQMSESIVKYPELVLWTVRIDGTSDGRGEATLNVEKLRGRGLAKTLAIECKLTGADDRFYEILEIINQALIESIAERLNIADSLSFPSTHDFMLALAENGGMMIERPPPENFVGSLSASLLISPSGMVEVTSTHDHICVSGSRIVGASFPQTTVPDGELVAAAQRIGEALKHMGVIGYTRVDFQASCVEDVFTGIKEIVLQMVNVNLGFSFLQGSFNIFSIMCPGVFRNGTYEMFGSGGEAAERHYALLHCTTHPHIAALRHGPFFESCWEEGVTFDHQTLTGTGFLLLDSFAGSALGVLAVEKSKRHAMLELSNTLDFVAKEIGLDGVYGSIVDGESTAQSQMNLKQARETIKNSCQRLFASH